MELCIWESSSQAVLQTTEENSRRKATELDKNPHFILNTLLPQEMQVSTRTNPLELANSISYCDY